MMRSPILCAALLSLVPAAVSAQPARGDRDRTGGGTMSVQQLKLEPITFELDVPYTDSGNPRQRLDIYLPKNRRSATLPVIVFFHGGGWMQGDKADGARRLLPFVRTGEYAGISAGYRLSGEAPWPAQIHDCKAAIRWVRANAGRYGLEAEAIGAWGRSAGSHLALMLGVGGDVMELEGDVGPHRGVSSSVAGVANFFGVSELMAMVGQASDIDRRLPTAPEAVLIGGPLEQNADKARAASPVAYITPNDPPVLTVHGTADRVVPYDQAMRLDAALKKARVPSYVVTVEGAGHGDFGTVADGRVKAFFDHYLRRLPADISTAPIPKPVR